MLINRDSKLWVLTAGLILVVATAIYIPYHRASQPVGPSGGTWPGFLFGVVGTLMMFAAYALTPRKKFRTMRVGRVYWWMQAHVWFGLLSFPVICYHAGFRPGLWGGAMTWALMLLFIVIEVSGIIGLWLQQVMPGKILRDVSVETIYEQIPQVVDKLRDEATSRVSQITERKVENQFEYEAIAQGSVGNAATTPTSTPGADAIRSFFQSAVMPALAVPMSGPLAGASYSGSFARLRRETPLVVHEVIADLQSILDERHSLERQRRLHLFLHAWLWVHVPLSFGLLVLILIHIVKALQYATPW